MTQETALAIMKTGENIFLTGAPGAGKTYVLNQYLDYLKDYGIEAAITAPTGIAASHIGGMTLHSFFGIGIRESLSQYDIENLTEKKYIWERMKNLKVLVIDEVSMLSPELLNSIDAILKTFKFSSEPFGGVQTILVGDFFQLPPVSKKYAETGKRFAFQSEAWDELNPSICYLETSFRHSDDILKNILGEIRNGAVSEDSMNHFRSRYKKNPEGTEQITRLYTHNTDVDSINKEALAELETPLKVYDANTKGPKKWTDKIFSSSLVLEKLELKKGALVFFIKNNYEKGYINGTLGEIVDFDVFNVPIVETKDGSRIKAERMDWHFEDADGKPKATVSQIPLRLAWAITVHKSQGMTLEAAEIDLSRAFEPGQGYVALSRITSLGGLKLMGLNDAALSVDPDVLHSDQSMRASSTEMYQSFDSLSEDEQQKRAEHYMKGLGGIKGSGAKKKKEGALQENKDPSYLLSKPFFEKEMSIDEIAQERDLTEATIM
ncbi:MAG: AAA family ATPase, partial [Candidatus Pacebacteria bacterium]|nr:AAA family ATPase [Candidatus Paceibacterota bacterium]